MFKKNLNQFNFITEIYEKFKVGYFNRQIVNSPNNIILQKKENGAKCCKFF
jgi:hypothetical protein